MWPEFNFQPETRTNYQPGKKTYDSVAFNADQFNWYRTLINMRKQHPVFVQGSNEIIYAEGKKLIIRRSNKLEEVIVFFNADNKPGTYPVHQPGLYTNLLTGTTQELGKKLEIPGCTAMVMVRK
jgi:glycosidase